ncbi:MAG: site-specific integrase [Prevotellaceae bacterium]|jgi:integrase|nr:site-specific integrase [Prevotellaceae bacterium]
MPKFTPTVRSHNEYNDVYIRISHHSKTDYIKTNMIIHKSGIKKGAIADYSIIGNCALKIKSYIEKINNINVENWTIQDLKKFLINDTDGISFSEFARKYIDKMEVAGRIKSAESYRCSLKSLEKYFGRQIFFHEITSWHIRKWIETLQNTARAKQMYPKIARKLFKEGCFEYNDYDRDILRIKNQPFIPIKIPGGVLPKKRYAEVETVQAILKILPISQQEELAQDISILTLCLAGINTIDLYNIENQHFKDGKLCYNRTKEKTVRLDKAYFEISVPEKILPIFEKYKGKKQHLFNFTEKFSKSNYFTICFNKGLKSLCQRANTQIITSYWLRHTWATVAQNLCGATDEQVAFCLNHASAHKVTRSYIEKDFSQVAFWNEKVMEKIFNS